MGVGEFIACFPDSVAGADIRTRLLSFRRRRAFLRLTATVEYEG
jgi:hypothetical protein